MPKDRSARILIQTDHPGQLSFLTTYLEQMGHSLAIVETGDQVLSTLDCGQFDLLLLDADRIDILDKIRNDLQCDAPILTVATQDEMYQAEASLALGAQDYLLEPFNPTLLKVRVTGCLEPYWWKKEEADRDMMAHIEHDMEIARRIQNNFLPHELPVVPGFELQACFYPARVVAGDWYDVFFLSNKRRLGFVIADVCDKGLPSALFMSLCRSLIRAFSQQNQSLSWMDTQQLQGGEDWIKYVRQSAKSGAKISTDPTDPDDRQRNAPSAGTTALKSAVKQTNNYILENHSETNMFATMFYGVLDPRSGNVDYINGGHNAPVVIDAAGNLKARLKPTGPAVGIMPDADFEIGHLEMDPGDTLYCFTDGVSDSTSPDGQHLGEKRLMQILQRPGLTAKSVVKLVEDTLDAHTQKVSQFDDVTMVAVHRMMTI
jgi:phosphoserine phosphatase RsbU/P